jgi:hypothetical protein
MRKKGDTEADCPPSNGHHPEHAGDGVPVRCCGEYTADDDHDGGYDDGPFAAEVVACQSIRALASKITFQGTNGRGRYPITSMPIISPTKSAFDTRVLTDEVYWSGYSFLSRTFAIVL